MLQIVIYKKLNFWEEYTPLSLTKKIGFLSNSIVAGTDQTPKMNNMYRLLIVDGTSLFQKMVLSISWPTWVEAGYANDRISLHCQSFLQQNQLVLLLPQHLLRVCSLKISSGTVCGYK